MSWWVHLEDSTGNDVLVDQHSEGGTQVLGGTRIAELNVTYNYSRLFMLAWPHREDFDVDPKASTLAAMLDGKLAKDTIVSLESAVGRLGTRQHADYWADTTGNAGHALRILLKWAKLHPEAEWRVS